MFLTGIFALGATATLLIDCRQGAAPSRELTQQKYMPQQESGFNASTLNVSLPAGEESPPQVLPKPRGLQASVDDIVTFKDDDAKEGKEAKEGKNQKEAKNPAAAKEEGEQRPAGASALGDPYTINLSRIEGKD